MKKYLIGTFVLNLIAITYAFGILGLFGTIAITGALYYVAQVKLGSKGPIAIKVMLLVPHILGIFVVHTLFHNTGLTLMIGMFELTVFAIFSSFNY